MWTFITHVMAIGAVVGLAGHHVVAHETHVGVEWNGDEPSVDEFRVHLTAYLAIRDAALHDAMIRPSAAREGAEDDGGEATAASAAIGLVRQQLHDGAIFNGRFEEWARRTVQADAEARGESHIADLLEDAASERLACAGDLYPQGLALATMPATLLARLPTLPESLQFRLLGDSLILLDTRTGIIVDVLRRALPESWQR